MKRIHAYVRTACGRAHFNYMLGKSMVEQSMKRFHNPLWNWLLLKAHTILSGTFSQVTDMLSALNLKDLEKISALF